MYLLRHQLAKPNIIKYIIKFRNNNGAATVLATVLAIISSNKWTQQLKQKILIYDFWGLKFYIFINR